MVKREVPRMAIRSTTTKQKHHDIAHFQDCDAMLNQLISEINIYLYDYHHNWLRQAFSQFYYLKCYRSWARVHSHLEKFLRQPRVNYSMMMFILENEIKKFPNHSFYDKRLKAIAKLIARGPSFEEPFEP